MKRLHSAGLVCATIALLAGCAAPSSKTVEKTQFPADTRVAMMRVNGLSCPLCAHNINQQLMAIPGVRSVHVDLGAGKVAVALTDNQPPSRESLAKAVDASGFSLISIDMDAVPSTIVCSSCECKSCACAIAETRCDKSCSCHS